MSLNSFKADMNFPRPGIGIDDKNIRVGSGVRTDYLSTILIPSPGWFTGVNGRVASAEAPAELANNAAWTDVTHPLIPAIFYPPPLSERMPFPCTPLFVLHKSNGGGPITADSYVRLRITGFDQFGNAQVEVTPWLTFGTQTDIVYGAIQDAGYYFYSSKVFSQVTRLEYQANSIAVGDTHYLHMGMGFEPTLTVPTWLGLGSEEAWLDTVWSSITGLGNRGGFWNQGIGLSRKMTPWIVTEQDNAGNPVTVGGPGKRDILAGRLYNVDDDWYAILGYMTHEDNKFQRGAGPTAPNDQEPSGGFLVGNSDTALAWDGDPDKVNVFYFPAADEQGWDIPIYPRPAGPGTNYAVAPSAYGLTYKLDVWLRTTIGEAHGEFTRYPTYRP